MKSMVWKSEINWFIRIRLLAHFLHILHWRITIRARPGILTQALLQWRFITMVLELVLHFFYPSSRNYALLFFKIFQNLVLYTTFQYTRHSLSVRVKFYTLRQQTPPIWSTTWQFLDSDRDSVFRNRHTFLTSLSL